LTAFATLKEILLGDGKEARRHVHKKAALRNTEGMAWMNIEPGNAWLAITEAGKQLMASSNHHSIKSP
jgi:hypothetical protein